ncbi:SAM-dependent methyltransferase [Amycolatopsis antarctica]|uniref:SAM-dependent methyltransferase n=1 Tax=Amycolatopsis antarctica TaxID=1854586 RepID=A0A263D1W2_9PSEU|nr:class I SAM-dependent methyltransferase [Amycolatopsis antarctica]OZM71335.1 SAM-dependent methyltransferase [Amycolatopsis antarctica]
MSEPAFLQHTRTSYDTIAATYAEWIRPELAARPLDRALLGVFAELVRQGGTAPVADIGCGPGRVSAHLDGLGVPVFGVDLSPGMVAQARKQYPALRFTEGSMTALDIEDGVLGGVLAWYSIIHVPDAELPKVFAEFHRVLAPGGYLQLAFQAGDEVLHLREAKGHEVALDFRRRHPDRVAEALAEAGLAVRTRTVREPETTGDFPESTPQAYLLAVKPAGTAPG